MLLPSLKTGSLIVLLSQVDCKRNGGQCPVNQGACKLMSIGQFGRSYQELDPLWPTSSTSWNIK